MDEVASSRPAVEFFETHPENFILDHGRFEVLARIRADYPLSLHAVGLSLGSHQGVDEAHIAALKRLVEQLDPFLISDHLSWSATGGMFLNDLLPLPYTSESLGVFARNVDRVQSALKRQILIENPSAYIAFNGNDYDEPEFLRLLAEKTGCGLLLDVNNVFVTATNLGFDAGSYLRAFPLEHVRELHVAGHHKRDVGAAIILIDDHGSQVSPPVWTLYGQALAAARTAATVIEWDSNIPPFEQLVAERDKAVDFARGAKRNAAVPPLGQLQAELAKALLSVQPETSLDFAYSGHLSIYRNNVRESLTEALRLIYPAVEELVGKPFFRQTVLRFIEIHPPREPALAAYGEEFAKFLEALPSCRSLPYLDDVARLEWRMSRASLHSWQPPLSAEKLGLHANSECAGLRFTPQGGISYISSAYPIDEIWSFARAGGNGQAPSFESGAVFLEVAPAAGGVLFRRLEEPEFIFRQALYSGADLGSAADAAFEADPLFVLFAALRSALADGIFTDCHIEKSMPQEVSPCLC